MAACSSSSMAASATTSYSQYYDVFINHRGPDTKHAFATPLYDRLTKNCRLQVFLDEPEMQVGYGVPSQIEDAIQAASVHVAVFSERYAESKWCLNELVSMLESGKTIIPVFYGVNPQHLRWTQWTDTEKDGPYAKALHDHEEKRRYDSQTIQQWRKALSDVANISGLELEAFNGDENELLNELVEKVLKMVPRQLDVAKYPTGLELKLEEFRRTVLSKQQDERRAEAKVVGIWGLGGAGKTTLAMHFFNCEGSNYKGSSIVFDVREKTTRGNLSSLQCKLIKDLKGKDTKIKRVEEGIGKLKRNLADFHALVILDDIDHVNQLDAFLPIKDVLNPDSLILVTTRDKRVLQNARILDPSIYHLKGLNRPHSQQLFCSHAFSRPDPLPGFEKLVEGFINACNGLPLSLKVLGALLCGENDISYWKELLDGLHKLLPEDIENRLRISYDSLREEEKQIFLDIACFCIGDVSDKWIRIWGGSGLVGFRNLQNKCLVEVDSKNKMRMHDHLRDMGRNIADSSKSMARRLWQNQDIDDLLNQSSSSSSEITEVRGIRMAPQYYSWDLSYRSRSSSDDVRRMSKLELLQAEGGFVESILKRVQSPKLKWLCWHACPYSSLPSWIPMGDLRVIEVHGRELKRLWDCKGPMQLRGLVTDASLVEFPKSLGQLKDLEMIVAPYTSLPTDFCYPPSLKYLELDDFRFEILPDLQGVLHEKAPDRSSMIRKDELSIQLRIGSVTENLADLRRIKLVNWYLLKMLPNFFGNITNLRHITLSRCQRLKTLPEFPGNLTTLQHINFAECLRLQILPDSLGNFTNLQHINLSRCRSLKRLPNSFGNLCQLEHLHLKGCRNLTISSETLGNMRRLACLDLERCVQMELLPPQVGRQQSLAKLNLWGTKLKELPDDLVVSLSSLEVLILGSPSLERLPPLSCLTSLKKLWLYNCTKLQYLPDSVELLSQLTELKIRNCSRIQHLPPGVMRMKNLKVLAVLCCPLRELPIKRSSLEELLFDQLQKLQLDWAEVSEVSFPQGVCANLQDLRMVGCKHLVEVGELPTTLKNLTLRKCIALRKIRGIDGVVKLEKLDIRGCDDIEVEELQGLEALVSSGLKLLMPSQDAWDRFVFREDKDEPFCTLDTDTEDEYQGLDEEECEYWHSDED